VAAFFLEALRLVDLRLALRLTLRLAFFLTLRLALRLVAFFFTLRLAFFLVARFFAGRLFAAFLRVAFLRVDVFLAAARFAVDFLDVVLRFEDPALRFVDLRRAVTFLAVAILPLPRVSNHNITKNYSQPWRGYVLLQT
jgi:hypothetical protein